MRLSLTKAFLFWVGLVMFFNSMNLGPQKWWWPFWVKIPLHLLWYSFSLSHLLAFAHPLWSLRLAPPYVHMYQRFQSKKKKVGWVYSPQHSQKLWPWPQAIIVGNTPDADLRRIVTATDGQCYQISHLGEGDFGTRKQDGFGGFLGYPSFWGWDLSKGSKPL